MIPDDAWECPAMGVKRGADDDEFLTAEIRHLLVLLDESFDRKAWHGPNLKGSIRRVSALEAAWRPRPDRHSIADNVVHCAYWKYAIRRRLSGEKRGSFAFKGSNWFVLPYPLSESTWKELVRLLESEHRSLRSTVASVSAELLDQYPEGGKVRYLSLLQGIAMHDVYHAGQIQLLKRLQSTDK
jgi:uncharacterized damage-inducible protein DinB